MPEIVVVVTRPDALHARPAARVVRTVAAHDADVRVARVDDPEADADARSITALLGLGVGPGDHVRVTATGPGATLVLAEIRAILEDDAAAAGGPW